MSKTPKKPEQQNPHTLKQPGKTLAESLGLDGSETFAISGVTELNAGTTPKTVRVVATKADGSEVAFEAVVRIERQGRRAEVRWGDHGDARIAIESGAIDPARRAELLDLLTGFLDRS